MRVRVGGGWGFAATRDVSRAGAEAALRRALAIAEAQPAAPRDARSRPPATAARALGVGRARVDPFARRARGQARRTCSPPRRRMRGDARIVRTVARAARAIRTTQGASHRPRARPARRR